MAELKPHPESLIYNYKNLALIPIIENELTALILHNGFSHQPFHIKVDSFNIKNPGQIKINQEKNGNRKEPGEEVKFSFILFEAKNIMTTLRKKIQTMDEMYSLILKYRSWIDVQVVMYFGVFHSNIQTGFIPLLLISKEKNVNMGLFKSFNSPENFGTVESPDPTDLDGFDDDANGDDANGEDTDGEPLLIDSDDDYNGYDFEESETEEEVGDDTEGEAEDY